MAPMLRHTHVSGAEADDGPYSKAQQGKVGPMYGRSALSRQRSQGSGLGSVGATASSLWHSRRRRGGSCSGSCPWLLWWSWWWSWSWWCLKLVVAVCGGGGLMWWMPWLGWWRHRLVCVVGVALVCCSLCHGVAGRGSLLCCHCCRLGCRSGAPGINRASAAVPPRWRGQSANPRRRGSWAGGGWLSAPDARTGPSLHGAFGRAICARCLASPRLSRWRWSAESVRPGGPFGRAGPLRAQGRVLWSRVSKLLAPAP